MDNFIKIKFSISIYIDNYHDEFEMYYLFKKFKGRFLLLSESCRKPTVSCGFKLLFMVKHLTCLNFFQLNFEQNKLLVSACSNE